MTPELLLQYLLNSELSPKKFAEACGLTVNELVAMIGGELEISAEVDARGAELADEAIRRNPLYS